uniref:Uncharacterized protein n=1 Tax=Chenopodium quinoa TaxID=63459 RepID=A0A803M1N0_CHEQI
MAEYINNLIQLQKWVNMFAGYILWLMMVYLTDVWELELIHAAAIINIWMGLSKVLPIVFAHLADSFLGNFFVVLFSSLSSMIGLGLIWMSTPPVLGKSNGNCTQYKPECIGEQQKQLLYAGLAFTAVGIAAHTASYAPYSREHLEVALVALLVAAFVKPWAILFGICAILGVLSFLACLILRVTKGCNDNNPALRPQGSPLTTIFRVLFAASSKSFCRRPHDANGLYEKPDPNQELLPHSKSLSGLDKAAIIKAESSLEQQEQKKMEPLQRATYFLEQAKRLDPRAGKAKAPLILFLWFYDQFRRSFTTSFLGTFALSGRYAPRIGIVVAMMYATLSCIAAAKVETRRLGVVKNHGLIDKPDERVPMTIFWLLPQFALLGGLDGIQRLCAYSFSVDQAPSSMIKYFNLFARGFFGLGVMGSVVSVYIVGMISEAKTGTNWFQSTLNTSRLDNYYWVLATLAAVNLVVYIVVACLYRYRESRLEQMVQGAFNFMDDDF